MSAGMSRPLLIALAAIFAALAALLVFVFGDWLREAIVVPVLYFFWLVGRIGNSIDQQILWVGLVVLFVFGITQIFLYTARRDSPPVDEDLQTFGQGRVRYWLVYVNLMLVGVYNRSYFSEELKRLILNVLALRERQTPQEVEKRIVTGDLSVPPQVLAFFTSRRYRPAMTLTEKAVQTVKSWVNPAERENNPEKLEDLQAVIAFLDEQMEKK